MTGPTPRRPPLASARAFAETHADAMIVVAITALAAFLRIWRLAAVPLGLHGDEALTGLDAERVLREGWIGPYVLSALGQPTGPLYFTALLFEFVPHTVFTVRLSMALFGVATIPLAYFAFTVMFNRTIAAFAAFMLAIMTWHLHLSRTGFMVSAWPFIEMAVLWALFEGLKRRSVPMIAVAGALAGLGIYTYNAYLLFLPPLAVPFIWAFVRAARGEGRRIAVGAVVFAVAGVIVAIPMILWAAQHTDDYRFHQKIVGVEYSDDWKAAGPGGKVHIVWNRAREWEHGLLRGGRPDLGDGLAADGHPVVDTVTLFLALLGLGFAAVRWRRSEYATVIAMCAVIPWGAFLTVGDGLFRRTFGLTPFIAVLAAFPLAWAWQRALAQDGRRFGGSERAVYVGAIIVVLAITGGYNVHSYFGSTQDTAPMRFVFPFEDEAASHYIAGLPPDTTVYFYSDRWSIDYETTQFIAPHAIGTDRSIEYRPLGGDEDLNYEADRSRNAAYVFLGNYLDDIGVVVGLYPGGTQTEGRRGDEVEYRAYFVPKE